MVECFVPKVATLNTVTSLTVNSVTESIVRTNCQNHLQEYILPMSTSGHMLSRQHLLLKLHALKINILSLSQLNFIFRKELEKASTNVSSKSFIAWFRGKNREPSSPPPSNPPPPPSNPPPSHIKIVCLHIVVFSEHDILHFWDNVQLFKYYPVKVLQNCFNSFNYSNQTCIQVSKFSFALDK